MHGTRIPRRRGSPSWPKRPRRAGGGPVVRGEDHQRLLIQIEFLKRTEDLADRPIELLDHVAEQAALATATELRRGEQRHVTHRVRQIHEKRPVPVLADKPDRLLGYSGESAWPGRRDTRSLPHRASAAPYVGRAFPSGGVSTSLYHPLYLVVAFALPADELAVGNRINLPAAFWRSR